MPIINADSPINILAALFVIVMIGFLSEKTTIGKKISAPLVILLVSLVIGNIGVLPMKAPVYDVIQSILVPMAIPLLLFRVDLSKVFKQSGTLLFMFFLATIFTIIGALTASFFIDLGDAETQIVAVLTASNIGGSANFVATSQATNFTDSSLYLSTLTADALGAVTYLVLLMVLPAVAFINHFVPSKYINSKLNKQGGEVNNEPVAVNVTMPSLIYPITASLLICVIAQVIATLLPVSGMFIIIITVLSLLVANFAKEIVRKMAFDFELGTIFMYIFFATIGVSANISEMFGPALLIGAFLLILIVVHLSLLLVVGHWLKLDLAALMIASCACILGPTAAAAIAAGQGWKDLVSPGMLVGVLGYAIATFIGVAMNYILA